MERREEYLITQRKENLVYHKLLMNIAMSNRVVLDLGTTLILNVSPDYSSIISQKLSHALSQKGEIIDVLNIEVPYPDETDLEYYEDKLNETLHYLHNEKYTNFIFVEAAIIRGSNYKWIKDKFSCYNKNNLLFCALFENKNSLFKSDCVGEYYNNDTQDLTFYWERYNKHWE